MLSDTTSGPMAGRKLDRASAEHCGCMCQRGSRTLIFPPRPPPAPPMASAGQEWSITRLSPVLATMKHGQSAHPSPPISVKKTGRISESSARPLHPSPPSRFDKNVRVKLRDAAVCRFAWRKNVDADASM